MRSIIITICLLACGAIANAQYAPQAGITGSTAIPAGSSMFTAWATGCTITRGYLDIAQSAMGFVSSGDSSMGVGTVDHSVVSLGDSGTAVLSFAAPIYNGPGADFAVFENGFQNPADIEEAFLDLAFVEVSSDGVSYFRFPSASETPLDTQIAGAGMYMNARKINNLAGKYVSNYGTPFDLSELSGLPGLDVDHIVSVRLVDVIGTIGALASYDAAGKKINDPYPSPFPTGGFDLDAVGVIHQQATGIPSQAHNQMARIYPNPFIDRMSIDMVGEKEMQYDLSITGMSGTLVYASSFTDKTEVNTAAFPSGIYMVRLNDTKGNVWIEKITKP
jgi:hypothetical protein